MTKAATLLPGIILLLLLTQSLTALAWQERKINVYGFVSQGYLDSNGQDYLADTVNGTFEFSEAAINVMGSFGDSFRVGVQLFARDLGDQGNHDVVIDWAYGEYLWKDALSFRIGRIKQPLGFYNQGRDADLLRPSVLLPQSVYPEGTRDLLLAYQGFSLYGNLPGDLEYDFYIGATSLSNDDPTIRSLIFQLAGNIPLESFEVKNKRQIGAALKWNTPLEGLALGISRLEAELEGSISITRSLVFDFRIPKMSFTFFSSEYQRDHLTLAAELFQLKFKPDDLPLEQEFAPEGWYLSGAWRFNDFLEIHYNYNEFIADKNDRDGQVFAAVGLPAWFGWQQDHTLGLRYDVTPQFILKGEWHQIEGVGLIWAYDAPNLKPPFKEKWGLAALKATFHF